MKRILITGGAGYIGSHIAKAVARWGWEPVIFDNFSAGHEWAIQWGPSVRADLADSEAIRSAIRQYRPDAVVHFAASAYVGESMVNPRKYFRNNVVNSLNLLDVMLEEGVDTIVFSSTCATYGIPAIVPISEDSPQQPSNPYGESKLFVEKALRAFGGAYSLHWAALRYFNAAGADPDGDLGEDHDPEPHLISRVIAAALDPGIVVDVFGADYPTPDGTAVRDYVHVCDLADAHLLALDCLWGGAESFNVNLGNSAPCSVLEVIAAPATPRCWLPTAPGRSTGWAGSRASRNWTRWWRQRGAGIVRSDRRVEAKPYASRLAKFQAWATMVRRSAYCGDQPRRSRSF